MKIENYISLGHYLGVDGLFSAVGSFGAIDAHAEYLKTSEEGKEIYTCREKGVELRAEFTVFENGVVLRKDSFKNLTEEPMEINLLMSRFRLEGNDYEVYTEYNAWQRESRGEWQPLVTNVTAEAQGIRACDGAAPMMALHNRVNRKNTVFHLLASAQWKISAKKYHVHKKEPIIVEAGFYPDGLRLKVEPQETIYLPEIFFFSADNKVGLDAYKLHEVYNELYPRKKLPIQFNTWFYCFDDLNIENLHRQIDAAKEMGFEAFMIDAGWFGEGESWAQSVGDWEENLVSGPKGRMIEISDHVREAGMVFGLWFEPERAAPTSKSVKNHPDQYINGNLLDFSNPDARVRMTEMVAKVIEKYKVGWVKFDFNDTVNMDITGDGFYRYYEGQRKFVEELKSRFPELYITNCASGGYRMELGQGKFTDSFWLSDNQGPYQGIEIVKGTLRRMPTALIERWSVQKYCEGFLLNGRKTAEGKMICCNDATWESVVEVEDEFIKNFLSGGPIGFTCDIGAFPEKYKEFYKNFFCEYKKQRDFFRTASARILSDTENVTVLQYSDKKFDRVLVQIFSKLTYAPYMQIYPVVDKTANYSYDGQVLTGKELSEDGIRVRFDGVRDNMSKKIELIKI